MKKYWNNQPCNTNHSKKKFLSRDYFNEIKNKRYFVESHIPKFANFKKYKNKNVLEIGCGIGTDGVQFLKNGANYTGVDLSNFPTKLNLTKITFIKKLNILIICHLKYLINFQKRLANIY